jgi:putative Mn2+ efflux pump MntP
MLAFLAPAPNHGVQVMLCTIETDRNIMKKLFENLTTLIYFFAATTLVLMALMIMGWSVYEVLVHIVPNLALDHTVLNLTAEKQFIPIMLQSVGAVIIAVAILDVAKYMIEEEVFRNKELRSPKEARETLTKIMVIVAIAVSIEALVYIFKAGAEDLRLLVYPAFLIVTVVLLIVGLGIYQKLSINSENTENE